MKYDTLILKTAQHNDLLTGKFDFTSVEIDLFVIITNHVYINGKDNDFYQFHISMKDLLMKCRINPDNRSQLKTALRSLQRKHIELKDGNTFVSTPLISGVKIVPDSDTVYFNIDPFTKPLLVNLRRDFTTFYISSCLRLTGKYSKRIYMLANQFSNTGIWLITVNELRERLKVVDKYSVYTMFYKKVIESSLQEINDKTELTISISSISKVRKAVTGYQFEILRKTFINNHESDEFDMILEPYKLTKWQINNIRQEMSIEDLRQVNYQVKLSAMNKEIKTNASAYLRGILEKKGVKLNKAIK